jgi:hypothetical protein
VVDEGAVRRGGRADRVTDRRAGNQLEAEADVSGRAPRPGACAPWCNGDEVAALPTVRSTIKDLQEQNDALTSEQIQSICAAKAMAASDILYSLSGRIYTGVCGPVTIRPLARPTDGDSRAMGGYQYLSGWGYASSYGANTGIGSHYLSLNPPEIDLGDYPVTEVVQVLIDGVEIPGPYNPATQEGEWELRDYRKLVRIRPTQGFSPTERWGWPTSQIMDLPDTQPGTFSVTYMYGQPPPVGGREAALTFAAVLACGAMGDTTAFPTRMVSMSRQGVSARTVDAQDFLSAGMTGIYEVDAWLRSVNPNKLQRQARVYSPDKGRPRRQATPSVSGGST